MSICSLSSCISQLATYSVFKATYPTKIPKQRAKSDKVK